MARSPISRSLPHLMAMFSVLVGPWPLGAGASVLDAASQRAPGAVADRLIVRARAGLHPRARHRVFAEHDTQEVASIEALGASVIRVPRGRLGAVAKALRRSGYFKSVERDYRAAAAQIPNDPEFANQWGLTKIGAPTAWNVTFGSSSVTVAIVDSGIDAGHPDLRNQLVQGYDFVNDDADPVDDNGHGTRMAGIVAARAFNGAGVAGVAPQCKLMPVKVLGSDAMGSYSAIANGITYAVDHGARVINLSLAGTAPASVLQSAVDYAAARGAVVVASAGNYGTGDSTYPAAYPNTVAVSASDQNDTVANFSNYGSWMSLAAPGVDITTTNLGGGYVGSSGTSPAAAVVSGAAALLFSAHPELTNSGALSVLTSTARDLSTSGWDPYAGWGRVNLAAAIGGAALPTLTPPDRLPTPTPTSISTGRDRAAPTVSIIAPRSNSLLSGNASVDVTAKDDVGVVRVVLTVDNRVVAADTAPPFGFVWDTTTERPGKHRLRARAYDGSGNVTASRAVKVMVASGVGLAVKRARFNAASEAQGGTFSLRASLSLPESSAQDRGPGGFSVSLGSAKGSIFSAAMQCDPVAADAHGTQRLGATAVDANGAVVDLHLSRRPGDTAYTLLLSASALSGANADALMHLTLAANGHTVSQSTPFRLSKGSLVFP